jgi:hypothetical protein
VIDAAAALSRQITSGKLQRAMMVLGKDATPLVLPALYQSTDDFVNLARQSFGDKLGAEALQHLNELASLIEKQAPAAKNFAMFAYRAFFYQRLAHLFSVSYVPHTWRAQLVSDATEEPMFDFTEYLRDLTVELRRELASRLNTEFGKSVFTVDFPVLASYVLSQTTSRSELLETAMAIRMSKAAVAFRVWIAEMESSLRNQSDLPKIAKAQSDLQDVVQDLRRELGLRSKHVLQQQFTIKVGVPPFAAVEAPASARIPVPVWLHHIWHRSSHLVFLRDVARQSVSLRPFTIAYAHLSP